MITGSRLPSARAMTRPVGALAGNGTQLLLTSTCLLFAELTLIRWIPSLVTYVGFFSNFLLMASFLGIGLGILLGRNAWRLPASPFPFVLLATTVLVTAAQLNVQVRGTGEIFFGLAESRSADVNFLVLPLLVVLVVALMAILALPLGPLLRSMPPLRAYAIDITGSLIGIAAFAVMSILSTPPGAWLAVIALLLGLMALGRGFSAWSVVGGVAMLAVIYGGSLAPRDVEQFWSPYYRIDVSGGAAATSISVNGIPHQSMTKATDPHAPFYDQIFKWFPGRAFPSVLIVGAGSGTDMAIALRQGGVESLDAVEIDPVIQRIGIQRHPNRPYQDARVTRALNDGRAFLRTTDRKYDLVIFALPDSLTLVSSTANLRLESFLFTEEAFASVRDHLTDGGVFVLYNYYREPWLITKIASQLRAAFGQEPIVRLYSRTRATFAVGPLVTSVGGQPPGDRTDPIPDDGGPAPKLATDDWPFLYLRQPFIATYYLVALAFMLGLAVLSVGLAAVRAGAGARSFSPHFFALGVAFLLLETKSLVSFSLLFGTTWIVNALAFFAILLSVLAAIGVTSRLRPRRAWPFYAGLLLSLAVAFALPPEQLLVDPPWLRYALAAIVAFAPVFFANLVFTFSFRDVAAADMAFASNLIGAMVGGVLEYLALLTGYRWLVVVVAIVYAAAYLLATRWRLLGDRALEVEADGPAPAPSAAPAAQT